MRARDSEHHKTVNIRVGGKSISVLQKHRVWSERGPSQSQTLSNAAASSGLISPLTSFNKKWAVTVKSNTLAVRHRCDMPHVTPHSVVCRLQENTFAIQFTAILDCLVKKLNLRSFLSP